MKIKIKEIIRKWREKFNSVENARLRKGILNALPFWIGALLTGVCAVLYAKLFVWAEEWTAFVFHKGSWLFFIIAPLGFVLAWWVVNKFAPYAKGSGIPQVSAAIELANPKWHHTIDKLVSLRIILVKVISSGIMVFSGGVIGREGPTIQIAASIFKKINDILPAWYPKISKRNMLVTGAAAGLASAFNTPLGGIVFAIEELTKTHLNYFKSALLTGVIIAGLTALHFLGPYLYIGYPDLNGVGLSILFIVILVALATGIGGSGMGQIILGLMRRLSALKTTFHKIGYILLCGLVIATFAYFAGETVLGSGKEIMQKILFTDGKEVAWYIPLLRIAGSIISFSTGAAGGIFAPSLSAGASIGAVMAGWFHLLPQEVNLVVLCGMVGFLTGITKSPFTSSILVIEMTNSHNIIFYLMLTGLLANIVANLVTKHSFYDQLKEKYIQEVAPESIEQVR